MGHCGNFATGWDEAMVGMRKGGRRFIVIPAALAYGVKGSPNVVPPNANLIFDVCPTRAVRIWCCLYGGNGERSLGRSPLWRLALDR